MKFKFTFILLVLIGQFFSLTAREVTSFNEGWLFKRGPFSEDPVKVVAQWEGKWETVSLPHTWNAKDMQVKAASCLLYTSPSPRDRSLSRMPSSA